jgi:beta-alanine--pyruvate transaminase
MGAVLVQSRIHSAFMQSPVSAIELPHGYTYSGHPLACAAAIATLDTMAEEGLLTRAGDLAAYWEEAMHSLAGLPHVIDIRNIGLIGAVELEPDAGEPGRRAYTRFVEAFERGLLVRATGDIIALAPPLTVTTGEIDEMIGILARVLQASDGRG